MSSPFSFKRKKVAVTYGQRKRRPPSTETEKWQDFDERINHEVISKAPKWPPPNKAEQITGNAIKDPFAFTDEADGSEDVSIYSDSRTKRRKLESIAIGVRSKQNNTACASSARYDKSPSSEHRQSAVTKLERFESGLTDVHDDVGPSSPKAMISLNRQVDVVPEHTFRILKSPATLTRASKSFDDLELPQSRKSPRRKLARTNSSLSESYMDLFDDAQDDFPDDSPPSPTPVVLPKSVRFLGIETSSPVRAKTLLDELDDHFISPEGSSAMISHEQFTVERDVHVNNAQALHKERIKRVGRMKQSGRAPVADLSDNFLPTTIEETLSGPLDRESEILNVATALLFEEDRIKQMSSMPGLNRSTSYDIGTEMDAGAGIVRHGAAVTYSRSRTYLGTDEDLLAPVYVSESQRRREEELESSDEDEERKEVKTVHELREAGAANRLIDHMEYTLDGLDAGQPLGVRRSSALDLCQKVAARSFVTRIRAHGFLHKFYHQARSVEDPILLAMISFIFCAVLQETRNQEHLVHEPGFFGLLTSIAKFDRDPLRISPRSKYEKRLIEDLKDAIQNSDLMQDMQDGQRQTVSMRGLVLRSVLSMTDCRGTGMSLVQKAMNDDGMVKLLTECFEDVCASKTQNGLLEFGIEMDDSDTQQLGTLLVVLRALEFATHSNADNVALVSSDVVIADSLALLKWSLNVSYTVPKHSETAARIAVASTSLLINLSNTSDTCVERVGQSPTLLPLLRSIVIPNVNLADEDDPGEKEKAQSAQYPDETETGQRDRDRITQFDLTMTGVALLINLVENSAANRDRIFSINFSKSCAMDATCQSACRCHSRMSAISCIASVVNERLDAESNRATHDILTAQFAVLLGWLIKGSKRNRSLAVDQMTGHFGPVISMLRDYSSWYGTLVAEIDTDASNNPNDLRGAHEAKSAIVEVIKIFESDDPIS
ncbi:wings apart-like protein regulation of heterochromatin-domain-containing protein [Phlyctochytrium arcticum]|nr:wings apart-like protein regulation of heterochromatin-domain-containing protein [Phlyctochytrium arcticum]